MDTRTTTTSDRTYLTRVQAADYLCMTTRTLDRHKEIPRIKLGGRVLFHRESLDAFVSDLAISEAPEQLTLPNLAQAAPAKASQLRKANRHKTTGGKARDWIEEERDALSAPGTSADRAA
ncbi:MAG: helix-turn-helix domain-containing protein [bacterium]|nr:helix-turn-helix domain-containing protein [bacterium]